MECHVVCLLAYTCTCVCILTGTERRGWFVYLSTYLLGYGTVRYGAAGELAGREGRRWNEGRR